MNNFIKIKIKIRNPTYTFSIFILHFSNSVETLRKSVTHMNSKLFVFLHVKCIFIGLSFLYIIHPEEKPSMNHARAHELDRALPFGTSIFANFVDKGYLLPAWPSPRYFHRLFSCKT